MQHDLFHIYTVDEHILNVIQNLRRFAKDELKHEFPDCHDLFKNYTHKHILYLAALFHDIAKGRGGDHSELGAKDVHEFSKLNHLPSHDEALIKWLVKSHLVMSHTAQKLDLSDPRVIEEFARKVVNKENLTSLYLLTVADIRATSPHVWNQWKATLLKNLFKYTLNYLEQGNLSHEDSIAKRKEKAARSAMSASAATNPEEKLPEEKVEISLLSQGSGQTHEGSEISSIEENETEIQDDPLFTEEEEKALNREPTAEERLTAE
jgi:[protein-PII] uridylyltransferase